MGVFEQEASLIVGLGKLPARRNRVGLCELLRLCVFFFSSARLAQVAVLLQVTRLFAQEQIAFQPAVDTDRPKRAPLRV